MRISFIMNVRMPTEKAHGYQISKMCEALALEGAQVSLMVPARKNDIPGDIFSYYGVHSNFSIKYIPIFDALEFFHGSRFGFYAQAVSFIWALRSADISRDSTIITRNPEIAWWYSRKRYRVFYDAHNFPLRSKWFLKWLLRGSEGIIANSGGTAEAFRLARFSNILVAPNAVDLAQFNGVEKIDRDALGLPPGRVAMYVGHLYEWKGIDIVVEAARKSIDKNLTFIFVGGTDDDLARYRSETKDLLNVIFLGRRPHKDVPAFIKSADVLLLPNIPITKESSIYTSPIKMFEYMASGVPIVASDLPSIKEVLNDKNAIIIKAGDPSELLLGIKQALSNGVCVQAVHAKEDVGQYTWGARARKIITFIKKPQ